MIRFMTRKPDDSRYIPAKSAPKQLEAIAGLGSRLSAHGGQSTRVGTALNSSKEVHLPVEFMENRHSVGKHIVLIE